MIASPIRQCAAHLGLVAFVLLATAVPAWAQAAPSYIDRVRGLGVDSLAAGFWVYYSDGYADRAAAVGRQVAASNTFYRDSLGIDVDLRIALLDPGDYERAAFDNGIPYGLPFVNDGLVVQPADLTTGLVATAYAPYETTAAPEVYAALEGVGLSYAEALPRMFDLIALHEIGHAQVQAYGLDSRQAWFGEFLATYLGYAYMRAREPDAAVIWDAMLRAGREGFEPEHTSLDDFNRLYAGVGFENYVWYQNVFQDRVKEVYDTYGLDFIREVGALLAAPDLAFDSSAQLLSALQTLAPGFAAWAARYE